MIYTDASKSDQGVAAAFYTESSEFMVKLNPFMSICNAELTAILYAVQFILSLSPSDDVPLSPRFVICTDSLSALQAVQNVYSSNPLAANIRKLVSENLHSLTLTFIWVPSHVGIPGNEAADRLAKSALAASTPVLNELTIQDCKIILKHKIRTSWNDEWSALSGNKLREIKPENKAWQNVPPLSRKQQVSITRLRIGHTNATHIHLIKKQDAPMCDVCQSRVTVKHVLKDCTKYQHIRSPNNLYDYLPSDPSPILAFIEKANLKI
ncbi:hypothetical protein WDU94_005655 [Cyamophila willieti]